MRHLRDLKPAFPRGKTCLLRVDFNVENLRESFRLRAALPTIQYLHRRGTRVVIISHRGRPTRNQRSKRRTTLRALLPFLREHFGERAVFMNHGATFPELLRRISRSPGNAVILLENLRFLPGEETNDPSLGKTLAAFGDFFVNDAFSVCHRKNASVTQLPRYLPSFAGLLLEREVKTLGKFLNANSKGLLLILGGAKASDKIGVMERFLRRSRSVLLGGVPANTFLKARGLDIDGSAFEPTMIPLARLFLKNRRIMLPSDFVAKGGRLLDIGPETAARFRDEIQRAKTIFWNGPMGLFEDKRFRVGSEAIARAIVKSRAFSIVGGGETTQLIFEMKLEKKIGFLSTGGGAMLEYLSGKKLPGLAALENSGKLR